MAFSVLIEKRDGQVAAMLLRAPKIRVVCPTREQALGALRAEIQQRLEAGELLDLEVGPRGVSALAGAFRDDPPTAGDRADFRSQRLRAPLPP